MKKEELESYPVIFSSSAKIRKVVRCNMGFSRWLSGKESTCNAEDTGLIPGSGRSPGEGNGNPLQYSCLGNPVDRGMWQATVHGVSKSRTRLSDFTFTFGAA